MFGGKSVLITGGTGSFGTAFVKHMVENHPDVRRLIVFSRDELKQYEMKQRFSPHQYPFMRYFIGDVRDLPRLRRAFAQVDIVVHAAALKQVPAAEYNPFEYVQTNIMGAQNVLEAALDAGIQQIVALSTDKAVSPINLYGATKLCSDKLFVAVNNIKGRQEFRSVVVRYGNVLGSRGSVVPFFLKHREGGTLPITHREMTRFSISLQDGVKMVLWALQHGFGGEIFVPKLPSYRITDLAEAIAPKCALEYIGARPGEKLHEAMISASDSFNAIDIGDYFIILPSSEELKIDEYRMRWKGIAVEQGFEYNSRDNPVYLTVDQIRSEIKNHVDPAFDWRT
jgi:UDP-N-acetylglucosamine 4,6-dehydratase/5-epimerase